MNALLRFAGGILNGRCGEKSKASDRLPEEKSRRLIDCCNQVGHRFRGGVEDAVTEAYRTAGKDEVVAALEAFAIKPGVELPWGRVVLP